MEHYYEKNLIINNRELKYKGISTRCAFSADLPLSAELEIPPRLLYRTFISREKSFEMDFEYLIPINNPKEKGSLAMSLLNPLEKVLPTTHPRDEFLIKSDLCHQGKLLLFLILDSS